MEVDGDGKERESCPATLYVAGQPQAAMTYVGIRTTANKSNRGVENQGEACGRQRLDRMGLWRFGGGSSGSRNDAYCVSIRI